MSSVQWPRDMVVSVDPRSRLLHLLYCFSALRLQNTRGLPPLISEPPSIATAASVRSPGTSWQAWWEESWDATRQWYRTRSRHAPGASPPRGPIDDAAEPPILLDDGRSRWFDEVAPLDHHAPARSSPEHVCLDALVPAWEAGLGTIVVLPYRGEHAQRLSAGTLLVSPATHHSPSAYRAALAAPPPAGTPAPISVP